MRKMIKKVTAPAVVVLGSAVSASAQDTTALSTFASEVAGEGATIAGYVATAMGGGLVIMAILFGGRAVIRGFKSIAK